MSVGVVSPKTLAKLASHAAKERQSHVGGTVDLRDKTKRKCLLKKFDASDVLVNRP